MREQVTGPRQDRPVEKDRLLEALTQAHPRADCYGRILVEVQDTINGRLAKHPEYDGDPRAQEEMETLLFFVGTVCEILQAYEISYPIVRRSEVESGEA